MIQAHANKFTIITPDRVKISEKCARNEVCTLAINYIKYSVKTYFVVPLKKVREMDLNPPQSLALQLNVQLGVSWYWLVKASVCSSDSKVTIHFIGTSTSEVNKYDCFSACNQYQSPLFLSPNLTASRVQVRAEPGSRGAKQVWRFGWWGWWVVGWLFVGKGCSNYGIRDAHLRIIPFKLIIKHGVIL